MTTPAAISAIMPLNFGVDKFAIEADLHGRGLWDASDTELLEAVWKFRRNFEAATVAQTQDDA